MLAKLLHRNLNSIRIQWLAFFPEGGQYDLPNLEPEYRIDVELTTARTFEEIERRFLGILEVSKEQGILRAQAVENIQPTIEIQFDDARVDEIVPLPEIP